VINIDDLIKRANALEPLPEVVTKLIALLEKDDVAIDEVEHIFSSDGALTARLLRQANSASSGSRKQIGTISAAVIRLGLGGVLALAISVSTQKQLSTSLPQYGIDSGGLWHHAQAASFAVDAMRRYCKVTIIPEAQTAALLHDIGKIVMADYLEPDILSLLQRANEKGIEIGMDAEREILEVHHGELGGLIAQHWDLPDCIVRGIQHHHDPEACADSNSDLCHIVCTANWIAKAAEAKIKNTPYTDSIPLSVKHLGISENNLDKITDAVAEKLDS